MRAHSEMLEFRIGDRVAFRPSGQGRVEGLLTRYNKKTVTVITDDGRQWNVSPNLLSRVVSPETASPGGADVVLLGKRWRAPDSRQGPRSTPLEQVERLLGRRASGVKRFSWSFRSLSQNGDKAVRRPD